MSELLGSANLTQQEIENLNALQDSADSLLNIINEILDFSKIEAGKMEIDNTSFNFRSLITSIVKTFEYGRKTEHIKLSCTIDDSIPNMLIGDYVKLRQILNNLLSNAFKFTEEGEIKVVINKASLSEAGMMLRLSVSDTGIGIPNDKINSLFESFHQLDSSTTRKYGGTGLGLSIVKKLVELMGGTIRVESELGKGSSFIFELPFELAEVTGAEEAAASISVDINVENLKILVAEDSKVNQMLMTQLLLKRNWEVAVAKNGLEVLVMLESDTYDLVLMDIQMPQMDGYEAARAIREKEKSSGAHIPIIALTANATEQDRNKCIECGMDDFLSKPIRQQNLYDTVLKFAKQ
jgi:CheY-like chemotaxis protein